MKYYLCVLLLLYTSVILFVFLQAEDGIRYLVRSRGLGDVYKRQGKDEPLGAVVRVGHAVNGEQPSGAVVAEHVFRLLCLLYTSDAADERSSVDLGGRRIIKKTDTGSTRADE